LRAGTPEQLCIASCAPSVGCPSESKVMGGARPAAALASVSAAVSAARTLLTLAGPAKEDQGMKVANSMRKAGCASGEVDGEVNAIRIAVRRQRLGLWCWGSRSGCTGVGEPGELNAMRSKFSAMSLAVTSPHETLVNWSQLVKAKFTVDNLHLTGGLDKSGSAQVISSVQQMGSTVGHLHSTLAQVASAVASLKDELAGLRGAVLMASTSPTSTAANSAAASTPAG